MLVEELVLFNVGVYRGEHRLDLATDDARPVILIGGLNGGGKTTILDALQLALYGKRARCSNRGSIGYEEFLRRTISRAAPAEEGAFIEVSFLTRRDGDDQRYRITRSFANTGRTVREDLVVRRDGKFDPVLTANWDEHLEELLPLEVASLFFFDGEKIEALADPDQAGTVIGAAIRSLFGLELVDRLAADLVALERRKRTELFNETAQADLSRLESILAAHEEHREAAILERARARTAVDRARIRLEKARSAYRAEGGDLFDAREDLERSRDVARQRVNAGEAALRELAASVLPLAVVRPLLRRIVGAAGAGDGLDPRRLHDYLQSRDDELLEALRHAKARRAVIDAAAAHLAVDRDALRQTAATHAPAVGSAARRVLKTELRAAVEDAAAARDELAAAASELENLDRQLAAVPDDDALAPGKAELVAAARDLDDAEAALQSAEDDLASHTRLRDDAARRYDAALSINTEATLAQDDSIRVAEHATRVCRTLDELRNRVVARHTATLEAAILDSLRRLLHKQGLISDLRLDPTTFGIILLAADGQPLPAERLSAGERQLLAVAILWGLARASGRQLPTVIDTPLGRLDSEHRDRLVDDYFPHASRQVVLLSTDEELDDRLADRLRPRIARSYLLDSAPNGDTTVTPGYFWAEERVHVA